MAPGEHVKTYGGALLALLLVGALFLYPKWKSAGMPDLADGANFLPTASKPPVFGDFPVSQTYDKAPTVVDFDSDPRIKEFKASLEQGVKKGPNFAGAYSILPLNCGEGCEMVVVVDMRNGHVSFPGLIAEYGMSFSSTSALLILNPITPTSVLELRSGPSEFPTYYVWDGERFNLVYRESR